MKIEIHHRDTGVVLFVAEGVRDMVGALQQARAGSSLAGASLHNANLPRAFLSGARLSSSDLSSANLREADLSKANLSGADLSGANLREADLSGANLSGANLSGANLTGANLSGANLTGASLRGANLSYGTLTGAKLFEAALSDATIGYTDLTGVLLTSKQLTQLGMAIPRVEEIDRKVLAAVTSEGGNLDMSDWHQSPRIGGTCGSTHCRAGWAIHLAGPAGYALEDKVGPSAAGALIYLQSTQRPVPDFRASNKRALADIRQRAGEGTLS